VKKTALGGTNARTLVVWRSAATRGLTRRGG
jgi:hypothetical protein